MAQGIAKPFYKLTRQELADFFRSLDRKNKLRLSLITVGAFLFIPLILWPAWVIRLQNQAQIRDLHTRIDLAQAQIHSEPQLVDEKKSYETFIFQTRSRLFLEGETQGLLGILNEIGQKSKVSILSSQPQTDVFKLPAPYDTRYLVLSYLIAIEGDYHALATFVSEIENYPKILRVDEFSVTPRDETPGVHTAEIRLSVFLKREGM